MDVDWSRWRLCLGGEHSTFQGVANQFRLVLQAEFLHEMGAMVFDCPVADMEASSNFGTRFSLGRQLQHLALACRQRFVRVEWSRFRLFNIGVDGDGGDRWAEEASSAGRVAHG